MVLKRWPFPGPSPPLWAPVRPQEALSVGLGMGRVAFRSESQQAAPQPLLRPFTHLNPGARLGKDHWEHDGARLFFP